MPPLAMELSVWYEGQFRIGSGSYGLDDRSVESQSHLFWGEALLAYTLPELKHTFYLSVTAGTSVQADRFSAYRLGSFLPLVSEFPLSLPGYYYQEISARISCWWAGTTWCRWISGSAGTSAATPARPWSITCPASSSRAIGIPAWAAACSTIGPSWKILVGYGYGVDAMRSHGRGAQSVGILVQFDLGHARAALPESTQPGSWRGFQQLFNVFGK